MNPFIKYPGGKLNELPLVKEYKPQNILRYFEPFVGGAAIYLNMHIKDSYINDKSEDLINLYKYVKKQDEKFFAYITELDKLWKEIENKDLKSDLFNVNKFAKYEQQVLLLKQKKLESLEKNGYQIFKKDWEEIFLTARKTALYMCIRDLYNEKRNESSLLAACFYFIREYCYSSMFRFGKNGNFNVPYGGRSYNLKYITAKIEQMKSIETIEYFKDTKIYNLDFEEFLKSFDLNESDFIFLDPPYDSAFSTYDNNTFDKTEQVRLAEFLKRTKAKWMMIIKKTELIEELYKNYYIFEYDKNYLVSFKNRNTKNTRHLLITNYINGM